jgi:hypothetical protein
MPSALRRQRWWKRIGGGWNERQRSARCKTERSGCKDWSTTIVRTRCVSSTRAHAAEYVNEIGQAVRAEGGRLPAKWLDGVLHRLLPSRTPQSAHTSDLVSRSLSQSNSAGKTGLFAEARGAHAIPDLSGSRLAHRLRERRKRSQGGRRSTTRMGLACVGVGRTSTPCSCSATRSAIASGTRPGRRQWLIDEHFARASDKQTVSSGWPAPFGSSSSGERGPIGCPIHLFLLSPHRRLLARSNQFVVLVLAIPGANPFSGVLLPPLRV